MKITKDFIVQNKTDNGGWTRKQLEAVGINWPPVKGWHKLIIGKTISEIEVDVFKKKEKRKQRTT